VGINVGAGSVGAIEGVTVVVVVGQMLPKDSRVKQLSTSQATAPLTSASEPPRVAMMLPHLMPMSIAKPAPWIIVLNSSRNCFVHWSNPEDTSKFQHRSSHPTCSYVTTCSKYTVGFAVVAEGAADGSCVGPLKDGMEVGVGVVSTGTDTSVGVPVGMLEGTSVGMKLGLLVGIRVGVLTLGDRV
jgi:hypothetical protein